MGLNKRKVSLWAYLFLFLSSSIVSAQGLPAWEMEEYFQLFKIESYRTPNKASYTTPEIAYLNAYRAALGNIILESPSEEYVQNETSKSLIYISNTDLPEYLKLYYQNDLKMLSAYMELKKGNELKFMWMMNEVYRDAQRLSSTYPDFLPGKKVSGILNVMLGSVPDQYQWILNLLGYYGDAKEGLSSLESINRSELPVRYESLVLSAILKKYLTIEDKFNSLQQLEQAAVANPDLSLLNFAAALGFIKQHDSSKAQEHLLKIKNINSPYINYLIGETYLHSGQYYKSILYFKKFITDNEGIDLIKDAYAKIYISYYILGDSALAEEYKTKAKFFGNTNTEADKNAHHILNDPAPAHPTIFQIRYFTDGGFSKEAFNLIERTADLELSNKDKTELIYRKARLYHQMNDTNKAIRYYKKSLENDDGRYFAPNAALQLGFIYLQKNQEKKAHYYFEYVLKFKNYTYENSIKGKAKHALKNIEQ